MVQAFPAAFNAVKKQPIKLIPGCEGYLIDETQVVTDEDDRSIDDTIVVLDFESTGLDTLKDRVIEIGAVKMTGGTLVDSGEPENPPAAENYRNHRHYGHDAGG